MDDALSALGSLVLAILLLFAVTWLTYAPHHTVAQLQDAHPTWTLDQCELVSANKVWVGMTESMALESWGRPSDVNRHVYEWGQFEQWVYRSDYSTRYLYFRDGVLTSWGD